MVSIERKYELEKALSEVNLPRCYNSEMSEKGRKYLQNYMQDTGLPYEEVHYLVDAYFMPYKEVLNDLSIYAESSGNIDTLSFLHSLSEKYGVDMLCMFKRVEEVKTIQKYKEENIKKR